MDPLLFAVPTTHRFAAYLERRMPVHHSRCSSQFSHFLSPTVSALLASRSAFPCPFPSPFPPPPHRNESKSPNEFKVGEIHKLAVPHDYGHIEICRCEPNEIPVGSIMRRAAYTRMRILLCVG